MMDHAEAAIRRKAAFDRHQRSGRQVCVSCVVLSCDKDLQWNLTVSGIEVASDRDQAMWVGIEQLVDGEAHFECLRSAFQAGDEEPLGPTGCGGPSGRRELLAGNRGRARSPKVGIDHRERCCGRDREFDDEHGPVKCYRFDRIARRSLCCGVIGQRRDDVVSQFLLRQDRVARHHHEIVNAGCSPLSSAVADCAHIPRIWRSIEQSVEGV